MDKVMDNLISPTRGNLSNSPSTCQIEHAKSDSTDDDAKLDYNIPTTVKTNICKYKTEICKNFSENGYCPYANKCQFAHGWKELHNRQAIIRKTYRTRKCKSFWQEGICRYGHRCQFQHNQQQRLREKRLLHFVNCLLDDKIAGDGSQLLKIMKKATRNE